MPRNNIHVALFREEKIEPVGCLNVWVTLKSIEYKRQLQAPGVLFISNQEPRVLATYF